MNRKIVFSALMLMLAALIVIAVGCKKDDDDDKTSFALSTLKAGDIDMNGATSPNDVPAEPVIKATFTVAVDDATATANTITMTRDYDDAVIELDITVSGSTIDIVPVGSLGNGALYKLSFKAGIKSTDGQDLTPFDRTFTTIGTFVPSGQIAHWGFEDNADDDVGSWSAAAVIDITYADSRNAAAGKAASFNGTTSIIEVPDGDQLVNTEDFTISFWVKTNSEEKESGHFVIGLGAFYGIQYEIQGSYDNAKFAVCYEKEDGTTQPEDMAFPFEAQDMTNGGWQGHDFAKSISQADMIALLKDEWLHVVYAFNGATKKGVLYYNGEKMKSLDFNLWPDDAPHKTIIGMKYGGSEPDVVNDLAFGFIHSRAGTMWDNEPWGGYDFPTSNHLKGLLDDVRFFHKTLTAQEIDLMYNSEKP